MGDMTLILMASVEAENLLYQCSYLPAKNIPKPLLKKLSHSDPIKLNSSLVALDSLILNDEDTVSIHDLFQDILVKASEKNRKQLLLQLGTATVGYEEDFLLRAPKKAILILKNRDGYIFSHKETPHWLALCYLKMGDLEEASSYFESSGIYTRTLLQEGKKILRITESPADKAQRYGIIGGRLRDVGRYKGALKYYQQVLEIEKKRLGEQDHETALCHYNIGICLNLLERYQDAYISHRQALEIREKTLGEENPDTAKSYHHVGESLRYLKKFEAALTHDQKSLNIFKKTLGEGHPETAKSYSGVGRSLSKLKRNKDALTLLEIALTIQTKAVGEKHRDTATFHNNLGLILDDMKKHKDALTHLEKALEIWTISLGDKHPDVATAHNNIGTVLKNLKLHKESLKSHANALKIASNCYEKEHPRLDHCLKNFMKVFITSLIGSFVKK